MRLIDAKKLEKQVKEVFGIIDPVLMWKMLRWIRKQKTIDAVPVVRCRDCKHRGTDYCIFHIDGEPADEELLRKLENDFCSYGERKDGGEKCED